MALILDIWSDHPNWMPMNPMLMFQICQNPGTVRLLVMRVGLGH